MGLRITLSRATDALIINAASKERSASIGKMVVFHNVFTIQKKSGVSRNKKNPTEPAPGDQFKQVTMVTARSKMVKKKKKERDSFHTNHSKTVMFLSMKITEVINVLGGGFPLACQSLHLVCCEVRRLKLKSHGVK